MGKWFWSFFGVFLNFGPFFGPFLGTVVENSRDKKVAPGNSINFQNKLKFLHKYLGPTNVFFQNVHFWGPNRVGGAWYGIFLIRDNLIINCCAIL